MKGYQPYSTFVTRASSLNSLTCCPFIHYTFVLRIAIMFLYDLGRATSRIQHLLKRASSLNSLTGLPIYIYYTFVRKKDPHCNNFLVCFREGYQPISTVVEEGILLQLSLMFSNVICVALWHSSKAADSVRHDEVLDILVIM